MKKNAIVIVTVGDKKFLSQVVKDIVEKNKTVITCYWHNEIVTPLSEEIKDLMGFDEKFDIGIVSRDNIELVLDGDAVDEIHGDDGSIYLDLPGFHIQFAKKEHMDMWMEYCEGNKTFEVQVFSENKKQVYYPNYWFEKIPTKLEKRLMVAGFANSLRLKEVPQIQDGLIEIGMPEVEAIDIEQIQYIRKEKKI